MYFRGSGSATPLLSTYVESCGPLPPDGPVAPPAGALVDEEVGAIAVIVGVVAGAWAVVREPPVRPTGRPAELPPTAAAPVPVVPGPALDAERRCACERP
jgi:hypothetical protein